MSRIHKICLNLNPGARFTRADQNQGAHSIALFIISRGGKRNEVQELQSRGAFEHRSYISVRLCDGCWPQQTERIAHKRTAVSNR